jgi:hypothetical protein
LLHLLQKRSRGGQDQAAPGNADLVIASSPSTTWPGKKNSEALVGIIYRLRGRLHRSEKDVLEEAAKRVRRHEALVQDVLPDLRNRLAAAEDAVRCREL